MWQYFDYFEIYQLLYGIIFNFDLGSINKCLFPISIRDILLQSGGSLTIRFVID